MARLDVQPNNDLFKKLNDWITKKRTALIPPNETGLDIPELLQTLIVPKDASSAVLGSLMPMPLAYTAAQRRLLDDTIKLRVDAEPYGHVMSRDVPQVYANLIEEPFFDVGLLEKMQKIRSSFADSDYAAMIPQSHNTPAKSVFEPIKIGNTSTRTMQQYLDDRLVEPGSFARERPQGFADILTNPKTQYEAVNRHPLERQPYARDAQRTTPIHEFEHFQHFFDPKPGASYEALVNNPSGVGGGIKSVIERVNPNNEYVNYFLKNPNETIAERGAVVRSGKYVTGGPKLETDPLAQYIRGYKSNPHDINIGDKSIPISRSIQPLLKDWRIEPNIMQDLYGRNTSDAIERMLRDRNLTERFLYR